MKVWYEQIKGRRYANRKQEYNALLNTYDWDIKRYEILKRDDFKCQVCGCPQKKSLRVHHIEYINGQLPWEHPDELLITLCEECHSKRHGQENLSQKFRKGLAKYIKSGFDFSKI